MRSFGELKALAMMVCMACMSQTAESNAIALRNGIFPQARDDLLLGLDSSESLERRVGRPCSAGVELCGTQGCCTRSALPIHMSTNSERVLRSAATALSPLSAATALSPLSAATRLNRLRGGATTAPSSGSAETSSMSIAGDKEGGEGGGTGAQHTHEQPDPPSHSPVPPVTVLVTTNLGSRFLDKKKRITLSGDATVAEVSC